MVYATKDRERICSAQMMTNVKQTETIATILYTQNVYIKSDRYTPRLPPIRDVLVQGERNHGGNRKNKYNNMPLVNVYYEKTFYCSTHAKKLS